MTIDLERIARLAQAATPGEWTNGVPSHNDAHMCRINAWPDGLGSGKTGERIGLTWHPEHIVSYVGLSRQQCVDNAEFIAACDPQTVLALVEEIRRLREDLRRERQMSDIIERDIERKAGLRE